MPTSPIVNINVVNNNMAPTEPTLGVAFAYGRTTKGEFNDADRVINSLTQFRNEYGSEIVPDGTPSNMERILSQGGKLRVCRCGALDTNGALKAVKGTLTSGEFNEDGVIIQASASNVMDIILDGYVENPLILRLGLNTKEYGGDIETPSGNFVGTVKQSGNRYYMEIYATNLEADMTQSTLVYQSDITRARNKTSTQNFFADTTALRNFVRSNTFLDVSVVGIFEGATASTTVTTFEEYLALLDSLVNSNITTIEFTINNADAEVAEATPLLYFGTVGNDGGDLTADDWIAALPVIRDYDDVYMFIMSHIHQHLATPNGVHQAAGALANSTKSYVYAIEIPKTDTTKDLIIAERQAIGINSEYVAYFGGGIKLYNTQGLLVDSDVLGTVIALHCVSASENGPWYSFSGQNRGLITDGNGPVALNYGSPGNYDNLNEIAQECVNMIVTKNTALGARATMLWHSFTSTLSSNSFRFLNVIMLILYLRKTLRPILERYLEEPNNVSTWAKIYLEVAPVLEDLQNRNGITEWTWDGDQWVSSYEEMTVNTEAEVRQGKYRAHLIIKEVVALQGIDLAIALDSTTGSVTIEQ